LRPPGGATESNHSDHYNQSETFLLFRTHLTVYCF
jgi:hypothetical protein